MRSSLPALLLLLVPFGTTALRSVVSKDATCGGTKGYTCLGSKWGNCCSQYNCSVVIVSSSTRASTIPVASSQPVSTDARCGPSFGGKTCQGSRWGNFNTLIAARPRTTAAPLPAEEVLDNAIAQAHRPYGHQALWPPRDCPRLYHLRVLRPALQ
ncbi:hypothetical protein SNOG_02635 [Parastagonospora nodorum SN15]|uniref:CBM1 domain-containing protein n=1 Tax=Phaeosphaeria nodorum (strain SN15 / ATCC MYA-4574 / FGSC 10173) TaxID=321614 RepID=Q0V029_PHANO|nr:hypothetical protein SNOG_02635 [Parastagonospora nodorum SN15]EAT89366.1 hypothetical protein SNOG_02635 [Parastagonospora nodorum SN15]